MNYNRSINHHMHRSGVASLSDLSRRSGVNRKAIHGIIAGLSDPRISTLIRLSVALDCKVSELLQEAER